MCKALTKKDLKCKNKAIDGSDYCRVHQNYVDRDVTIFEGRCSYILKNCRQCKHKPEKDENGVLKEYCTGHINLIIRQKEEEEKTRLMNKYNKVLEKLFIYRNFFLTDEDLDDIISIKDYLKNFTYENRTIFIQMLEITELGTTLKNFNLGAEAKRIVIDYKFLIIRKKDFTYYEALISLCDQLSYECDNFFRLNVTSLWKRILISISEVMKKGVNNCFELNLMTNMCIIAIIYTLRRVEINTYEDVENCIKTYKEIQQRQNDIKKKWEEGNMKELRVKELKKCDVLCDDVCEYIIRKYL